MFEMIKNNLHKIFKNRLVKSVVVVASGTAGAQAIGMAFVPFITRTYGPEVYGALGAFIALTGILTALATLAYPVAIVLPKSDNRAKSLVKLSLLIAASISFLMLIVLLLVGEWLMPALGVSKLVNVMFFIPLVMFLMACQDISQQWLIRKKAFKGIAKVSITHSFVNYGSQALVGLYAPLALTLISVHTIAIGLRSVLTAYIGVKLTSVSDAKREEKISFKKIAYDYRSFPLYHAPQMVLNAVSQSLPILMLTAFFGPISAGYYTLTRTVLSLPSTLLGASVQSVFYPHFNEAVIEKKKTFPLMVKATLALAVIGGMPFLIIILFGPELFSLIFGLDWVHAGEYAQWLSGWLFFGLINRPSISSIPILGMQKWFLKYEIVSITLRILAIFLGFYYLSSDVASVAIFSVVGVGLNTYLIFRMFYAAKQLDKLV